MSMETTKMNLRSRIKSLNRKRSKVACKMADAVGITGDFFSDELPFDDPRISSVDVEKYDDLCKKIYDATWELDRLEYIDDPKLHEARKKTFTFINSLSLEASLLFLKSRGCSSTFDLIEKVKVNPNIIPEWGV